MTQMILMRLLFLLTLLLSVGCGNQNAQPGEPENYMSSKGDVDVQQSEGSYDKNVMENTLSREVMDFIEFWEQKCRDGSYSQSDVIIVLFEENSEGCFLFIFKSTHFESGALMGFEIIKDQMIAFYNIDIQCAAGLVKTRDFRNEPPEDFPNEYSDIVKHNVFEPFGRRFKIHSSDELELVYEGFL